MEKLFKILHIKKPDKLLTYIFYGITIFLVLISLGRMLSFLVGDATIANNISPYLYAIFLIFPALSYCFYVNSGIPKNDTNRINMYIITCSLLAIILGGMSCTWIKYYYKTRKRNGTKWR